MTEKQIIRNLAASYYEKATSLLNAQRMEMHRAVNDLKMIRPVVLIDEIPFHELNFDGSLSLISTDPFLGEIECFFRKKLFQWKYFPADMILPPYFPVYKVMNNTGIGIKVNDTTIKIDTRNHISAHEYHDQLSTPEDLEKIVLPKITYDEETTMHNFNRTAELIGDIMPVRIVGYGCYTSPWDNITRYRGANNLLIDLVERPEFTHQIVSKIFACEESRISQMEDLGLLDLHNYSLHCTAGLTSDLKQGYDGGKVTRKHIWGRGMAQIFATVGKAMHEEFDIDYMKRFMAPLGLVYYGCCEPLDKKIDIVEKLPNLRKVSITPWADIDASAEILQNRYVLANKPNPAAVATTLDEAALKKEISKTLQAVKRNGCSCDIVLKDISSAGNNLQNLVRWEQIVMEMVNQ